MNLKFDMKSVNEYTDMYRASTGIILIHFGTKDMWKKTNIQAACHPS